MQELALDRGRHFRAALYVLVSLVLSVSAYFWLGFDRGQTLGYAVATYVALNVLNYRAMFSKRDPGLRRDQSVDT